MKLASLVLLAVATELSELARSNMPVLRKGETIQREWFENATLYRETNFRGRKFITQFCFLKRKSHMIVVNEGNENY